MSNMLVLLPPSESKATRTRGEAMDLAALSFPELRTARSALIDELEELSRRPDACELLGVSPGLANEVARNVKLRTNHSLSASRMYAGVLFDALDLRSLDASSRRRASRRVVISSALYGALRLSDRVAPYRLSMNTTLPGAGRLASFWRDPLVAAMAPVVGKGIILDCRSAAYAASWKPTLDQAERWVQVTVPGASHMAKHTRGLVARQVCIWQDPPTLTEELPDALSEHFEAHIDPPVRPGRPWILSVTDQRK